jgi:phage terminase large subunit-like protein
MTRILSTSEKHELWKILEERDRRKRRFFLDRMFPETGPYRRELYPKHLEFFRKGKDCRERLCLAANRIGKTMMGAYETAVHLTGRYPAWWEGKHFDHPIDAWVAGDTRQTTRDILQHKLLGTNDIRQTDELGTGMIPGDDIESIVAMSGLAGAAEQIRVKHRSGGVSFCGLKSFDQGRRAFQGTSRHLVWVDEECPINVYAECLTRTMTTQGFVMLTFTPLQGWTPLVLEFLPGGKPIG